MRRGYLTHGNELCDKGWADDPKTLLRIQRATAVAQKRRAMYFGGCASKKQPVGKHALIQHGKEPLYMYVCICIYIYAANMYVYLYI